MTTYTITGAAYANAGRTAAVIQTAEAGGVLVSQQDTPDLWAAMLARGSVAAYAEPQPPVPTKVPLFQARFVMGQTQHGNGTLLDAVKAAIEAMPNDADRALALEAFAGSPTISRRGRLVTMLAPTLGLSDAALDALFRAAAAVEA